MLTTMLHIPHPLDDETHSQLCAAFEDHEAHCSDKPSTKAQLLFVDYDEQVTAPARLVEIAASAGYPAQVVDL